MSDERYRREDYPDGKAATFEGARRASIDSQPEDRVAAAEPRNDDASAAPRNDLARSASGPAERSDVGDSADVDESSAFDLGRRSLLKATGSLALLGAGASALDTATAETADTSKTVDDRIQEHRTGDLEVIVQNPDGTAVDGAQVSVTQQAHDFGFGTAVNANTLINQSSAGDEYRTRIPELFNEAVLENRHKWRFWENEQQLADDATNWLLDQGLDIRGHVCIWGRDGVSAIPSDVQTAIDNRDAQTIRDRSMQHIADIISHYGDDVTEWEVVNEAMHAHQLQIGVYGDRIDQDQPWTGEVVPWTSQLLADWYEQAASDVSIDLASAGVDRTASSLSVRLNFWQGGASTLSIEEIRLE